MSASRGLNRSQHGGFAMITALMLIMISVMLVTAYVSLIQSWTGASASENYEMIALSAAMAGVQHALAELISDTPTALVNANKNVIITETLFHGKGTVPLLLLNGGFEDWATIEDANYWTETGAASTNRHDTRKSGAYAARFESLGASYVRGLHSSDFDVSEGDVYNYGVSYYRWGADADDTTNLEVTLEWIDASSAVIGQEVRTETFVDMLTWLSASYTSAAAPVGAVAGRLRLRAKKILVGAISSHNLNLDNAFVTDPAAIPDDRQYEFIEIQNSDSVTHDLNTGNQYWISVGDVTGANKRYIHPFPSTSAADTLGPYDIGVVVAIDADTPYIANLSGKTPDQIRWFGLGALAGPATDTLLAPLAAGGARGLADLGDSIIIGYGGTATSYWSGFNINEPSSSSDTSWQKLTPFVQDDTTTPYSDFNRDNWETKPAMPGVAFVIDGGEVDGARDTWYRMASDSFTQITPNAYYRIRVYDEGGKVNVNTCTTTGNFGDKIVENLITYGDKPNPPFSSVTAFTAGQRTDFMSRLRTTLKPTSKTAANLLTPGSPFYLLNSTKMRMMIPFMTVYGYAETTAWKININTAESPALRAGMVTALDGVATAAEASVIADKIHMYITNPSSPTTFDKNPFNDATFTSIDQVPSFTGGLTAAERTLLSGNIAKLKDVFRVSSSGYFMIQVTGFVFKTGADPSTATPYARSQVIAVVRRNRYTRMGEVIFWREVFEDDRTLFPVTPLSRRFPSHPWDPVYD